MKTRSLTLALLFASSLCLADATVEQTTQFHLSGPLGGLVNIFSRSAREGTTSTTLVRGNRKLTRNGDNGELIDLDTEKVYSIDFGRQSYSVKTFAQLRKEWEEQQAKAKKEAGRNAQSKEKNEGPEYDVDFNIRTTGNKEVINGFNTREQIATVTVREKGKKLEQSGGFVLTTDMWMGPKLAVIREMTDFDRRFAQKLYGASFAADMRSLAAAVALTPAFGKALKTFQENGSSFEGSAIRTNMTFETVAGADQPRESASRDENREEAPSAAAQAIGGLFNKMKNRRNGGKGAEAEKPEPAAAPGHSQLFTSTTEVKKASASASASDVALPAGFRPR